MELQYRLEVAGLAEHLLDCHLAESEEPGADSCLGFALLKYSSPAAAARALRKAHAELAAGRLQDWEPWVRRHTQDVAQTAVFPKPT